MVDFKQKAAEKKKAAQATEEKIITPETDANDDAGNAQGDGATTGTAVSTDVADVDFSADSGLGQNFTTDDLAIPRLGIVQSTSKQILKGDKNYIEGAQIGMIYDNVSRKLWSGETGIQLIPVSYRHTILEWIPPKLGGGFVKDWQGDATILQQATQDPDTGAWFLPNGHELVTTAEYYVLVYDPALGQTMKALLSMAKTQYRKAKGWNTMINQLEIVDKKSGRLFNPAMFYRSYTLKTQPESNDKGHWFGWNISGAEATPDLENGAAHYLKARSFYQDVAAGKVKVADPEGGSYAEGTGAGPVDDAAPM